MKFRISVFATFCLSLLCIASAEDYEGPAGKGYRWVTVNGPYACTTEQEVRRITNNRTDATELQMVEDIEAYYLFWCKVPVPKSARNQLTVGERSSRRQATPTSDTSSRSADGRNTIKSFHSRR
jgi:hypothetical protein